MTASSDFVSQLEAEYCPPLETATFLAILSDYDISRPDDLQAARQTLDALSAYVDIEEASGFDPSGSSGRNGNGNLNAEERSESEQSQRGWSSYTDDTSSSQGMSALDLEGLESTNVIIGADEEVEERDEHLAQIHNAGLENLDEASKIAVLTETFPGIRPFDIKWTLNKCKGKAALAIDELLNQVFLEDSGHRYRGIEAFSESEVPQRSKKGKGRKKGFAITEDTSSFDSYAQAPAAVESKWEKANRDVEFISSRTKMPPKKIKSLYHQHGASVPATISAIIEAHILLQLDSKDVAVDVNAQELSLEFPTIPTSSVLALTQITHPSTAAAHELAKALATRPQQAQNGPPIQIEFRLPPPDLDSPAPNTKPKSHNAVFTTERPPPPAPHSSSAVNHAQDYISLRDAAFAQAATASRRGKSDPLMLGAAAHYRALAHSYHAAARSAASSAADALVARQSSPAALDLHGTTVSDAVRIARDAAAAWWPTAAAGAGAEGARGAGGGPLHTGFKIVTGKGTHSEGGKGKLGPAVGRMLIREGWKVEVRSGFLLVTGVAGKSKAA